MRTSPPLFVDTSLRFRDHNLHADFPSTDPWTCDSLREVRLHKVFKTFKSARTLSEQQLFGVGASVSLPA